MDKIKNRKGFFTLIGLVLAMAIILILLQNVLKNYYGKPILDKTTQQSIAGSGIDVTTYHDVVGSTRQQVQQINQQMQDYGRQIEQIK
jgi:conjugal transfer/entry exclusion protein